MADRRQLEKPQLTVVGSRDTSKSHSWQAIGDGTAAVAVGGVTAGGFGVETIKSFAAGEAAGRWWFVGGLCVGLALVVMGLRLRERARRSVRVGIVVTAFDSRLSMARGRHLTEQAESFSRAICDITLRTSIELPGNGAWDRELVNALADETLTATAMAERLAPDAAQVNLFPTMPLHIGFWLGARLGHRHPRNIVVHGIRQADGVPPFFPATCLRAIESGVEPLISSRLETIEGGDPSVVALAVDLQSRGDHFLDAVKAACREHEAGFLLVLRSTSAKLRERQETFVGVVEQVHQAWLTAPLLSAARTGRHMIFLSGPLAIAVALGARLASGEQNRWTAFAWDGSTSAYEAFPGLARTVPVKADPASSSPDGSALDLVVSDRVNHEKFGLGTVTSLAENDGRTTATIDFDSSGTRRLMLIGSMPMYKVREEQFIDPAVD